MTGVIAHSLKVAILHWKIGAMYEMQYRLNFVLQVIQSAVRLATGLVAIELVFGHTGDLSGWSQPELLAVLGVHILLGGIMQTFIVPNMFTLMFDIVQGDFDFSVVRPVDAQVFVSTRRISFWSLVDVALGGVVIGWAISGLDVSVGILDGLAFAVTLVCGMLLVYCIWMVFTTSAFKLINVDDMAQLLQGLYEAGRWPVRIYPFWLQGVLTVIVPLGFAITVPAEALTDRLTPAVLALTLVVTGLSLLATRAFWRWGIKSYSGASA